MSTTAFGTTNAFGTVNEAPVAAPEPPPETGSRRKLFLAAGIAGVLVAAAAAGGYVLLGSGGDDVADTSAPAAAAPSTAAEASAPADQGTAAEPVSTLPVVSTSAGRNPFLPLVTEGGAGGAAASAETSTDTSAGTDAATDGSSATQGGVGTAGATGATGAKGDKGDKGDTGATGAPGATPTYVNVMYLGQCSQPGYSSASLFTVSDAGGEVGYVVLPLDGTQQSGTFGDQTTQSAAAATTACAADLPPSATPQDPEQAALWAASLRLLATNLAPVGSPVGTPPPSAAVQFGDSQYTAPRNVPLVLFTYV